jgi:hypothetical protein
MPETALTVAQPSPDPHSLTDMLASLTALCSRNHGTRVSIGDVVEMLGPRSFAPLILAIGLIALTPIDSIPTLPTTFGAIVLLTVGQMLVGRSSMWLPGFIARRAVNADRLKRALAWLDPKARWADRHLRSRLIVFTRGPFVYAIAASCAALALTMPMLELLPFVSTIPAAAFTAFGIALLLHDGVAALLGFAFSAATLFFVVELVRLPF